MEELREAQQEQPIDLSESEDSGLGQLLLLSDHTGMVCTHYAALHVPTEAFPSWCKDPDISSSLKFIRQRQVGSRSSWAGHVVLLCMHRM